MPDEILVKFLDELPADTINQLVAQVNGQVHAQISGIGVTMLKVPAGEALQAAGILNTQEGVEYAEPNYLAYAMDTTPNDPSWSSQYGPNRIQAMQAWDITTGSTSIVLAVVDTGVDLDHPDLASKIVAGYDFANGDNNAQDDNGHGTHVAGIAAAASNNGVGIAGVSWGARIMPVKVLDANGSGSYSNIASGVIWAADNGAKVINLSLGGSSSSSAMEDAINYAYNAGVAIFAAAGNSGSAGVLYPAAYANAIAVAATDSSNNVASFSTYGPEVEVAAPGVSIYATYLNDTYASLSGTPMATPHVAGVAAVLAGQSGFGTPAAIRAALQATALDRGAAGWDQNYGYGIVQLHSALLYTSGPTTPTPTKTPSPPASFPFSDDFESSNLGSGWTTYITEEGRVRVAGGYPYQGTYSLLLDDSVSGSSYSTSAAILTLNLSGQNEVELEFWWREFSDENHVEDGVFISADSGGTWYRVLSFNGGTSTYQRALIELDVVAATNGIALNDHFQIKFQFRDNYSIATDGYSIDNVNVQVGTIPTNTPTPSQTLIPTQTLTPTQTFTPGPTNTPNSSCAAALALAGDGLGNSSPSSAEHTEDSVLVKFDENTSEAIIAFYVDAFGAEVSGELSELGVMVLKVPAGEVDTVVSNLNQLSSVEFAEPNYIARAFDTVPNDPSWSPQYGPRNIQGPQAWDLTTGSSSVTIAVIDTGVDLNHPDLSAKVIGGCDFVNRDDVAQDDNGHGTHVAGIAAAASNNGVGIAGVSWGARVMPVKVLSASGSGSYQDVASGIIFAADNGAQIINMSLGGSSPSSVLEDAVNYAFDRSVLIVASAGNGGNSTPNYPAAYTNAFAVAATDSNNNRASFSTYGNFVDIAAPGVSIFATYFDDTYASLSGTSMSAPHVAGAAALLFGYSQYLDTGSEVRTALESTALDLGGTGWDQYYGHGLIQLLPALLFDPNNVTPTPTLPPSPTPTNTPIPQSYYYVRSDACGTNFNFDWIDATDGSNLNLRYDDYYGSVVLPFDFFFNGQSYRNIYVSTNGFISFETSGAAAYFNLSIPNSTTPNEIIAPFWDDLNPFFGGDIFVKTIGTSRNRKAVVQWNNVPHYSQEGSHTFQAILYEGSNEIVFQYGAMSGNYAYGNSATIGLEYAGGTAGVQFAYNTANSVYEGLALKFAVANGPTPTPEPVCTPSQTATSSPTPDGSSLLLDLVAYWKLDEGSGTRTDVHGGNNLTSYNTVTQVTGRVGNAAHFVRAEQEYLRHADNSALSMGNIDFSLALWVNLEDKSANQNLLVKDYPGGGDSEYRLMYHSGSDRFQFRTYRPNDREITLSAYNLGAPATNTWYFILIWHDAVADTVNMQVNNGLVDTRPTGGSLQPSGVAPFQLGASAWPGAEGYSNAHIDEVGFWKRVLTASERAQLYNGGNGTTYPFGPVATPTATATTDPSATVDLTVSRVELIQGATMSDSYEVHIAGRSATLRVFVGLTGASSQTNVNAQLTAYRNGSVLANAPITASNGPITAVSSPSEGSINDTLNFTLPSAWLQAGTSYVLTLDPANVVPETNEANNNHPASGQQSFNFVNADALDVVIVPVAYQRNGSGSTYYPNMSDWSYLTWMPMQALPVSTINYSIHSTVTFTGELSSGGGWSSLIQQIEAIHASEDPGRNKIYYGVFNCWNAPGSCAYAGLGYLGWPTSIGWSGRGSGTNEASSTFIHEMGHNFNREHVRCTGSEAGADSGYPYNTGGPYGLGGHIGQWGLDSNGTLLNPSSYNDYMSYCSNEWTSDYTYRAIYDYRSVNFWEAGLAQTEAGAIYIGGVIGTDGVVNLLPLYRQSANISDSNVGTHRIELIDAAGAIIAIHRFTPIRAEDGDGSLAFSLHVPVID